ncbi:MAG: hypothetical protein ACTSR5_10715 [Promethearchaeota archaeon]
MDKVEKISLTENWRLLHKERDLNIPTKVPGSVFETLIDKEIIANPLFTNQSGIMKQNLI